MARCPFAKWHPISGGSGNYTGGPAKIVHHTTEGSSAAGAFQAFKNHRSDPHFTVDQTDVYQHIDTDFGARALRNAPGGVETNRDSAIQIEVVGLAGSPKDHATLQNVARLCRWIELQHRIPAVWPSGYPKPPKNGGDPGGHSRNADNWDNKSGHYGHCHVPENTHWDPAYSKAEVEFLMAAQFDLHGELANRQDARVAALLDRAQAAARSKPEVIEDHADVGAPPPTRRRTAAKSSAPARQTRKLDALPDTIDFRDALYTSSLIRVPPSSDLAAYRKFGIPVLDQGQEGACTGFGLATVANYLIRARGQNPKADEVSAWMLYVMAKRYDEWPGESYSGSSARGAMKGWYKHGLCALRLWKDEEPDPSAEAERSADAIARPLGAYYRVNHKDLVAMHAAITEVGVLYATSSVHEGWSNVKKGDDDIVFRPGSIGGHAFAIVGYDHKGFWIQNSWGEDWGLKGLARVSYADWLANGSDVWVAALGVPVAMDKPVAGSQASWGSTLSLNSQVYAALRPHIVTSRNDGLLDAKGAYGLTPVALEDLIKRQMVQTVAGWSRKRLVLYAHGGLVSQDAAVQTVAANRDALLQAEVYPLSFIWRSDAWSTLGDILSDAISRRRDTGILDRAKDFMFDRIDDMLEPVTRLLGGKTLWDEMKENATGATTHAMGSARLVAGHVAGLVKSGELAEVHLVGHSAGSIFHAPLARLLHESGVPIKSLSLWAPACTMQLFQSIYRPLIESGAIEAFDLYIMDDSTERDDDCANIYHKSLLYLVSRAFEEAPRIVGSMRRGTALLGLERDVDAALAKLWNGTSICKYVSPGPKTSALHHGDFDNNRLTLESTLARITGQKAVAGVSMPTFRLTDRGRRTELRQDLEATLASRK